MKTFIVFFLFSTLASAEVCFESSSDKFKDFCVQKVTLETVSYENNQLKTTKATIESDLGIFTAPVAGSKAEVILSKVSQGVCREASVSKIVFKFNERNPLETLTVYGEESFTPDSCHAEPEVTITRFSLIFEKH